MPRVVGPIRRKHPVEVRDVEFLRANTDRMIKMTVPGPFTMSAQCQDDFYGDEERRLRPLAKPDIPRRGAIDELYDTVVLGKPPVHTGEWAMATLEVCLAILRSAAEGR